MSSSRPESGSDLNRFRELCVRLGILINGAGIPVVAYDADTLAGFRAKSASTRASAIEALSIDILILESMLAEGLSLRDSRQHLSRFISMLDYEAQPDILEKIAPDDTVEVYLNEGSQQHQIFRNWRYFENTSFTIEQLFGMNWKISYIHEASFTSDIVEAITHCLTAARPATVSFPPREHTITEIGSPKSRTFLTKMKYLSPLTKNGQIKAFLSTNHSRILASAE